ncbi:MAG: ZIP family metal transporter [Desulfobacterales bacterium]
MSLFSAILIAGIAACAATTAGILTISRFEVKSRLWSPYFIAFAAGVLIGISFLHLVPKALTMDHSAGAFFLGGFIGLFVLELIADKGEKRQQPIGILVITAMGFHSLIDGTIYSITFTIDMLTGTLTALGMVLHEFPEGVIIFTLLEEGGYSRKKSIVFAFLATALTTPAGALFSFPFISRLSSAVLGRLLAVSAGFLIYLGAVHLLPMVIRQQTTGKITTFFAGILLGAILHLTTHT